MATKLNKNFETFLGFVVITITALIIYYIFNLNNFKGYNLQANFTSVDGINIGSEVRLKGVRVGKVTNIVLNKHMANLLMVVEGSLKIPEDSSVSISTDGLFGPRFVQINLGASQNHLLENQCFASSSVGLSLDRVIGKFLHKR